MYVVLSINTRQNTNIHFVEEYLTQFHTDNTSTQLMYRVVIRTYHQSNLPSKTYACNSSHYCKQERNSKSLNASRTAIVRRLTDSLKGDYLVIFMNTRQVSKSLTIFFFVLSWRNVRVFRLG